MGLFLNFIKAFDIVNHQILLNKRDTINPCEIHILKYLNFQTTDGEAQIKQHLLNIRPDPIIRVYYIINSILF